LIGVLLGRKIRGDQFRERPTMQEAQNAFLVRTRSMAAAHEFATEADHLGHSATQFQEIDLLMLSLILIVSEKRF